MIGKEAEEYIKKSNFFKDRNIEIVPLQEIKNLGWTFLVIDKDTKQKYRVKTQKDKNEKEIKTIQFLQRFPKQDWMPEIITVEDNANLLVTPFIDGITLNHIKQNQIEEVEELGKSLYKIVESIHTIKFNAYEIEKDKEYKSWYDLLKKQYEDYLKIMEENQFLPQKDINDIRKFVESMEKELKDIETTFVHADLKGPNIVYQKDKQKIIPIDYEVGFVGDPDYDWVRILMKENHSKEDISIYKACINCDKEKLEQLKNSNKYLLYRLKVMVEWYVLDAIKIGVKPVQAEAGIQEILQEIRKQQN